MVRMTDEAFRAFRGKPQIKKLRGKPKPLSPKPHNEPKIARSDREDILQYEFPQHDISKTKAAE